MTEFKRKKGESFESFLRRFNKGLRNSKTLNIAREKRTLAPKKSILKQKKYALKSLELRKQKNYLRKIGKLPEEETTYRR
jgi:ribosomal protein S21